MKKPLIVTGSILGAFLLLFIFNRIASKKVSDELFAEVKRGGFEITISASGELVPENSVDILGPEIVTGRDIRVNRIEIQDLIPEGTIVKKGDYIGTLNRTELANSLKDAQERLIDYQTRLEVRLLDSAVQLNGLRDQIKNQEFNVQEREMTLMNSKFEPPTVIRQAEINVEQAKRVLDQTRRNYTRRHAQINRDINHQKMWIARTQRRVNDLEDVLAGFTILAPADGMVIYKREWRGNKRKTGSFIDPRDRVVATLPDLNTMMSKIFISEIDINKIKEGQEVDISVDAFPSRSYKGSVSFIAKIGEKLPNTNDKVFEVQIRVDGSDPALRPSMTTSNKVIISKTDDVIFIPTECIHASADSIPFVYKKNRTRQVVVTGAANDKNTIIERGLEPGTMIYMSDPLDPEKFRLTGDELIPVIRERERMKRLENNMSAEVLRSDR